MVSRQAVLDECSVHFPELAPLAHWCYGQHPVLFHQMGIITSEMGVQQGDPLGPLLFCLVMQKIISTIGVDPTCNSLKFHSWYIDDGVVAGPSQAVKQVISILHTQGPPLGLFLNTSKCELFSKSDLSTFPPGMKRSSVPNIKILGAPIGDDNFCTNFVAQKWENAGKLLTLLEEVGAVDPQVGLLLLIQCGSFSKLVHLA